MLAISNRNITSITSLLLGTKILIGRTINFSARYSNPVVLSYIIDRNPSQALRSISYMVKRKQQSHEKSLSAIKSNKSLSSLKSLNSGGAMRIQPIRALQDNYMYLLVDDATRQAAAVDPVNASAIASAVHDYKVDLKAVLTTHHHHDHAHGNSDLLSMFPDIQIYGGDVRVQALTKQVDHGDNIKLGSLNIECLATPCHTKGHICYYVTCETEPLSSNPGLPSEEAERSVFTGDTLFIAGCGRFFEGTAEQMNRNLNVILAGLPNDTKVYCGHEYTVTNLKFALSVEPQNIDVKGKLSWAQTKVARREPTVPSTIGEEKRINPFMRLKHSHVKEYTGETDEIEVLTVLRHRKNEFRA